MSSQNNMAKGSTQKKNGVHASIARSTTNVKKEKSENYERASRRFQLFRATHGHLASTPTICILL